MKYILAIFITIFSASISKSDVGDTYICKVPHSYQMFNPDKNSRDIITGIFANSKVTFTCNPDDNHWVKVKRIYYDGSEDIERYKLDSNSLWCPRQGPRMEGKFGTIKILLSDLYIYFNNERYSYTFTQAWLSGDNVFVSFGVCNKL